MTERGRPVRRVLAVERRLTRRARPTCGQDACAPGGILHSAFCILHSPHCGRSSGRSCGGEQRHHDRVLRHGIENQWRYNGRDEATGCAAGGYEEVVACDPRPVRADAAEPRMEEAAAEKDHAQSRREIERELPRLRTVSAERPRRKDARRQRQSAPQRHQALPAPREADGVAQQERAKYDRPHQRQRLDIRRDVRRGRVQQGRGERGKGEGEKGTAAGAVAQIVDSR